MQQPKQQKHTLSKSLCCLCCLMLHIFTIAEVGQQNTNSNKSQENHCEQIGVLAKAFAEARDQNLPAWQAQHRISQYLNPNKQNQAAANQLLSIPGGLAYSQKQLNPTSLFALGKYLCMSSSIQVKPSFALKYLIESAQLCQTRMKVKQSIYACVKLAYQLLSEKYPPKKPIQ